MIWVLFIVVLVLVVGGFAALITARVGYDPMSEPTMTQSDPGLEEGFAPRDITEVRFDTALRGYRMDQVDAVLDRLQDRITELEARVDHPDGPDRPDLPEPAAEPPQGRPGGAAV